VKRGNLLADLPDVLLDGDDMKQALANLVAQNLVSYENAAAKAHDQLNFKTICGKSA